MIPDMDPTRPAEVDPKNIIDPVNQWGITQAFGSPALWTRVGQHCEQTGDQMPTLKRVLSAGAPVPEERLAQELAFLAVKTDIREELDRLTAHIASARALFAAGGAIGRKLDFLSQELNREANTLCAKASCYFSVLWCF